LLRDQAGTLYGTTSSGGKFGRGTVFKLDTSGLETVLHSFMGYPEDGSDPEASLIRDLAGNLYGTTATGGMSDLGTVFKLDESGNEIVLHDFAGGTDGNEPEAGLFLDSSGSIYGTTFSGGSFSEGIVFEVDQSGVEAPLYSFAPTTDGAYPRGGLIPGEKHHFYGTTSSGNPPDEFGTVFELTLDPGAP
jgi:uncharacterized repeat protein (TIGR03803 family)